MKLHEIEAMPRGAAVAQMDAVGRLGEAMKRIGAIGSVLEELDGELDRQLYDDEYVRQCRNSDLDVPNDCEHHVVVTHEMWRKIKAALKLAAGQ
jgi:hypothetical protein